MDGVFWVSVGTLVALGPGLVGWLIRTELRERQKERFEVEMAAHYQKIRPALPASEPEPAQQGQQITVAELMARLRREERYEGGR
jgi:hypothetical protein